MEYYKINEVIINNSNTYLDINNYNTQVINMSDIIKQAGIQIPAGIINMLFVAIGLLLLYYYIVPIWYRYFKYAEEASHALFTGALSLTIMVIISIIYYTLSDKWVSYLIWAIIYIFLVIGLYAGSKYLIKRKEEKR